MASIHCWDLMKIALAVFEKITVLWEGKGTAEGPIFLKLECSHSPGNKL
jgi:hypothetical protein